MEKEIKKFNDAPFSFTEKKKVKEFDTIELNQFAESLATFANECETPMTIGLQGDWGTGKTSLMNMIKCTIPDINSHKIEINTWHYSMFRQDEYLGVIVIKALLDELAKLFEKEQSGVAKTLFKMGRIIGAATKKAVSVAGSIEIGIPGGGIAARDAIEAFMGDDNKQIDIENLSSILMEFKKTFAAIITENVVKQDKKIFFFIDDLDRIRPGKAVEVLETLKNFMDVDGCVFILAVDYEIVQLGIQEKFGKDIQLASGKSFFDKIIQLPFSMPTSSYRIDLYLKDLLEKSNFYGSSLDANKDDMNYFVDITEVTIGRNPRSIKRAINYAKLLEIIRSKNATKDNKKDKMNSKLLYTIVCMQIAWPELFNYFLLHPTPETVKNLENWDFLERLPNAKKLFARVNNPEETRDNISAFFDTLYSIIDTNEKDGIITREELQPLLEILQLVRLTSEGTIKKSENQLVGFLENVRNNSQKNPEFEDFFTSVFMKSQWVINDSIEYKKAGERYLTMVYNRKQIGSIVTLKGKPFLIRLKESSDRIIENLTENSGDFKSIVSQIENGDTLTGIGDTMIDFKNITDISKKEKIEVMNQIFYAVVKLINN